MQPVTPMIDFFLAAELADFAHHLSLRQVADGAGIEKEKIGIVLIVDPCQAPFFELAHHDLGVELVHLAAIGANKKCFKLSHRRKVYCF